jgi:hypothetical protein
LSIASHTCADTPPFRPAAVLIGAVAALALAGAALAAAALAPSRGHADDVRRLRAAPAWVAAASFGPVVVEAVERGGHDRHGARHDDPADRSDEVRVRVALTNRLDRPVAYSPGQFRLGLAGAGSTISPVDPTPPPDSIPAGATIEQRLAFVVPVRRSSLSLVFEDVGARGPSTIALGVLRSPAADQGRE